MIAEIAKKNQAHPRLHDIGCDDFYLVQTRLNSLPTFTRQKSLTHKERGDETRCEKDLVNRNATDQGLDMSSESDILVKELVPMVKDRSCKPGAKDYHSYRPGLVPALCRWLIVNEELGYQVASTEQRP